MYEQTYDIIDWKSCASRTERASSSNTISEPVPKTFALNPDDVASNSDIVFPTLFHERNTTETSIVTLTDYESDFWPSDRHGSVPGDMEQLTVYQKVANWVFTQKKFFQRVETSYADDDLEVIDPEELFHESILNDYLLITEDDAERRAILRDLYSHRYHVMSIEEAMQTHECKFIRQPKCSVELELERIIEFGKPPVDVKSPRKRLLTLSSSVSCLEKAEENMHFLGVPRLLENYVILNREGYMVNLDEMTDLWLSPFEENSDENMAVRDEDRTELEFLSSWFSDVYQTGCNDSERMTSNITMDIFEKATVITFPSDDDDDDDDDEVWYDAPSIPHWLDDQTEELELFNQPSKPLYYYRDRIKGCYRIIGVEDETVVLFSGNDDDSIFYPEQNSLNQFHGLRNKKIHGSVSSGHRKRTPTKHIRGNSSSYSTPYGFVEKYRNFYDRFRPGKKKDHCSDTKNDSGIDEDIDDVFCNEPSIETVAFSDGSEDGVGDSFLKGFVLLVIHCMQESFVECSFVLLSVFIMFIAVVLYAKGSPILEIRRSKITEESFEDLHFVLRKIFT